MNKHNQVQFMYYYYGNSQLGFLVQKMRWALFGHMPYDNFLMGKMSASSFQASLLAATPFLQTEVLSGFLLKSTHYKSFLSSQVAMAGQLRVKVIATCVTAGVTVGQVLVK